MLKLNWLAVALAVLVVSGCSSPPRMYKGVGSFQQENFEIDIQRDAGLKPKLTVLLNDETALTVDRPVNMNNDSACEQLSLYVWNCNYLTDYRGMDVRVVERWSGKPLDQYVQYDVYLDGQFLQRIRGSL